MATREETLLFLIDVQVRNANASAVPFYVNSGEQGSFRDEALSPPAGH